MDLKQRPLGVAHAGDEPTNDPTDKPYCLKCGHWWELHDKTTGKCFSRVMAFGSDGFKYVDCNCSSD
jgi:hypothetical protein